MLLILFLYKNFIIISLIIYKIIYFINHIYIMLTNNLNIELDNVEII
jgi:hypothetical protein